MSGIDIYKKREAKIQSSFRNETYIHIAKEQDELDEPDEPDEPDDYLKHLNLEHMIYQMIM